MSDFASICISAWNRPELLLRCLNSLWQNTKYPYELVIHDDGSQPETIGMLNGFLRTGGISTLITNPPGYNRGHGTSVNRAVNISEGKYIVKLNGDDEFTPGWLGKAVRMFELFPEIGLLHLACYDFTALWNRRRPEYGLKDPEVDYYTLHRETREGVEARVVWCGPGDAFMWTRDFWKEVGPWFSEYDLAFGEDVYFRLKACPMARRPLQLPGHKLCPPTLEELPEHWKKYKDTPWLVAMDPPIVSFAWGEGLSGVHEAQKTLKHGPLLLGGE